jgi:hypothetical protein
MFAGYQIVDREGGVVADWGNANRGYAFDLDDVDEWLRSREDC